jgi:hypothetical protein
MHALEEEKTRVASVEEELSVAAIQCREALLAPEFKGLDALIPDAPSDAEAWFELLSRVRHDPKACATIMQMRAAMPAELVARGVSVERYAVLNGFSVALPRIASVPVPNTVKRLYAMSCAEIARGERQWENHFNIQRDSERFIDVAQMAALQRFPAGVCDFVYDRLAPIRSTLCVHPLSLPRYLYRRIFIMPLTKLAITPHLNYGRKNSYILAQTDYERSLWLMAKTIEMNPKVKSLNGWSWFYSQTVGEFYPHLGWLRALYVDGGAYVVDTFPATHGFSYNNRKRQILYEQGKFCPRQTAIFWARDSFLDWASRHPELIPEGEQPVRAPERRVRKRMKLPRPARHAKRNSSITLWDGMAIFDRIGALNYVAVVLISPALILSLAAFFFFGPWAALLGFPAAIFLAHAFQYFFSQ